MMAAGSAVRVRGAGARLVGRVGPFRLNVPAAAVREGHEGRVFHEIALVAVLSPATQGEPPQAPRIGDRLRQLLRSDVRERRPRWRVTGERVARAPRRIPVEVEEPRDLHAMTPL